MRLYFATIMWYDSYGEGSNVNKAFLFAESMTEAVEKINHSFEDIESLTIEEVNAMADDILYVPNDINLIRKIREENFY